MKLMMTVVECLSLKNFLKLLEVGRMEMLMLVVGLELSLSSLEGLPMVI
jgi:hypothetical protein